MSPTKNYKSPLQMSEKVNESLDWFQLSKIEFVTLNKELINFVNIHKI